MAGRYNLVGNQIGKIKFVEYFLQCKHKDAWFKWVEWLTLTVLICTVWWKSESNYILPFVVISVIYIWHSLLQGLSIFIAGYLSQWNLKPWQIKLIVWTLFPFFLYGPFFILVPLFVGIFGL